MNFNYFIPLIHFGPLPGYFYKQELPLEQIGKNIIGNNAKFEIIRKVVSQGQIIYEENKIILYNNKNWSEKSASLFEWSASKNQGKPCYIETQINLVKGSGLHSSSLPSFYVSYTGNNKKSFLSCGNEKYGNPRVIMQMKEFGQWIDGYPAININRQRNITYSLVVINPYKALNSLTIEVNDLNKKYNFKINKLSVKVIDFYDIIKKNIWSGQFYIYGKRRAIIYLINHSSKHIGKISTLEHSDPFRAEFNFLPKLQNLRNKVHKKLKDIFN